MECRRFFIGSASVFLVLVALLGHLSLGFAADLADVDLPAVIDRALRYNPQTREAWANVRYQAAQVGVAKSAYLPSVDFVLSANRNDNSANHGSSGNTLNDSQIATTLSLSYLLYDFGGRTATLERAQQVFAAANATQSVTVQSVLLAAVQAYYQWYTAQAIVMAAKESERFSQESLKSAVARYKAGTATSADKLQAQTAVSQATLTCIRAEGDANSAQGNLANIMGMPADQPFLVSPPPTFLSNTLSDTLPDAQFEHKVADLIDIAKRQRPDLAAAEAQVMASRSGIDVARATGMPSLSLFANRNDARSSIADPSHGNAIGITVRIPIFSGSNTTYQVYAAEAQLDIKTVQRDQLALQVSLDVWRAYYALMTETQAIRAVSDLLSSATQSAKLAQGRYRVGVGNILDMLSAQSALISARQQYIQEFYNWRLARATLAQAMGQLDYAMIATIAK